ncbi:MAG TPA: response regulator [Tepidisphaeraceae bacterium]|jgi:two-component system response regulator FixJ|nr:response regulator [Tepidisphaeraceae bacterium]
MNSILIHIVDDDPGLRRSMEMMLHAENLPVETYESAEQFLHNMDLSLPGCVILDLRMRGMGGMELLAHLRRVGHDIPVLIMSGHADVPTAVQGMKLGAVDVLQKPFEPAVLLETIRRAIETSHALHHHRAQQQSLRDRVSTLTDRELELLKLLASGKPNKLIARELGISIKTVANHRASLMSKTGALNAADLGRLSVAAGIMEAA